AHQDPTGRNGHVFFERAFYDGAGEDRAHDRATRRGPIIPVNRDTGSPGDDLVVVWYATNAVTGLPWPSRPVRYVAQWPASPGELVLASGAGSGVLPPQEFPDKRVYNQPDRSLSGFNPNEEHAALYGDTLYALRNDLNDRLSPRASEPYTLLKHRDPVTREWTMKVYRVLATNAQHQFVYEGEAGKQLQPPAPLSLLPLCGASNSWSSGPGFQDHLGRLHARAAGPAGSNAVIVARYFYPLQPGFFHDFGDGANPPPVGACVPWLDRRPGGEPGTPVEVTYHIRWPDDVPTLQIGETLFGAKFGLPDLRRFARATVLFDEGDPDGRNALGSLVRLFDPLAPRVLQLRPDGATDFSTDPGHAVFRVADAQALFAGLATANDAGLTVFTSLPYTLRARLRYDAPNRNLIFRGLLDEGQEYGGPDNPLLLLNVLSPRERERLKDLNRPALDELVDALYDLTRNPSRLDLDNDGEPDPNLLVGLTEKDGRITTEDLGDGPKILSAGQARAAGYVTVVENDDPALGGLPVTLHVLRVEGGPVRGDLKVVQSDNVFDEKLTLRHSADFGGEPQNFSFEWFYRPAEAGTDPGAFPTLRDDGEVEDLRGWTRYVPSPPGVAGVNDITLGDGGESSLLVLADNWFVCRHRGYSVNGQMNWSDWVGVIGGGQAQLAEGWVKRVRDGLNPFEARTRDFHANETVTFASMLQQAGRRYEGDIAFNPGGGNINQIGLIEAYETVLRRARRLSIEGVPEINYQPANDALLLAAGFIADLYFLLGNEAVADAADPTIGFRTSSAGYGTLAPSIFTFQNQLDSLLEEEIVLLRGRDDRSATVRAPPVLELHPGRGRGGLRAGLQHHRPERRRLHQCHGCADHVPAGARGRLGPLSHRDQGVLRAAAEPELRVASAQRAHPARGRAAGGGLPGRAQVRPRRRRQGPGRGGGRGPHLPPELCGRSRRPVPGLQGHRPGARLGRVRVGPPRRLGRVPRLGAGQRGAARRGSQPRPHRHQQGGPHHRAGTGRDHRGLRVGPGPGGQGGRRPEPAGPGEKCRALRHGSLAHRRRQDALRADLRPGPPGREQHGGGLQPREPALAGAARHAGLGE
ncbi:MAG TPA: hypothetical protein PKE47_06130, partial [Verrucomicrobiota bacterium]|nr:hypothetical protein [Verrucomicrobiota bacterium]